MGIETKMSGRDEREEDHESDFNWITSEEAYELRKRWEAEVTTMGEANVEMFLVEKARAMWRIAADFARAANLLALGAPAVTECAIKSGTKEFVQLCVELACLAYMDDDSGTVEEHSTSALQMAKPDDKMVGPDAAGLPFSVLL